MKGREFARKWMGRKVKVAAGNPHKEQWIGWVVGFTYRRQGKMVEETDIDERHGLFGRTVVTGRSFRSTGPSQLVVLVKRWPWMKAQDVPIHCIELAKDGEEPSPGLWSDRDRKDMADIVRGMPRDSKGRFIKEF